MKKYIFCLLLFCCVYAEVKKVFINKFVDHKALDITVKGIIDGLAMQGYIQDINLDLRVESAQANIALASQISSKFMSMKPDVIVGVATISAQSAMRYAKSGKVKLIFSSVTDPLRSSLVASLDNPGTNISGVSNFINVDEQLDFFRLIQPNIKRLGFIYNPGEVNSLTLIKELEKYCSKNKIKLVLSVAHKTSEVAQSISGLVPRVDAVFISNDSTALSSLSVIINIATKSLVPVYVSDIDAVDIGALAAIGPNQYQIGIQTSKMIVKTLDGDVENLPVEFPENVEIYLNENAAQKLHIVFSDNIKSMAKKIIKKS